MAEKIPATPRKSPCATCPYRKGVPSGVWAEEEYDKLPAYDGETFEQPTVPFFCHQGKGNVCAGWLAFRDPAELLAVRLGVSFGTIAPECMDYSTDVALFESGEEAAEHGKRDIENPSDWARVAMRKITRKRNLERDPE